VSTIVDKDFTAIHSLCMVSKSYNDIVIWAGGYEKIFIIDRHTRNLVESWTAHSKCRVVSLLSVGNTVWSSGNNKIFIWTTKTLQKAELLATGTIHCLEMVKAPNGKVQVWSGSFDEKISIWDSNTHKVLKSFVAHQDAVQCIIDAGDGRIFSSSRRDKTVKCWLLDVVFL